MIKQLGPGLRFALLLTVLTGLIYPGVVMGICQLLFPYRADGSFVSANARIVGSALIGQNFTRPEYFHPRPSSAGDKGYDPMASGGSNFGPTNQKLIDRVKTSVADFRKENPDYIGPIPADIVTASASGLDPQISPAAAELQCERVAKARGVGGDQVRRIVARYTEGPAFGFLGESRVNVLQLNLALDQQFPQR
jgi:potassium-transporting ATPase KdpC subunit